MNEATVGQKIRRMINRTILRRFPACKDIVHVISASLDRPLTLREKFLMKVHLFACKPCVRYLDQSSFLSRAIKIMDENETDELFSGSLSEETRTRLKTALRSGVALLVLFITSYPQLFI